MKKFYTDPEAEVLELDSIFTEEWETKSGGEIPTGGGEDNEDIGDLIKP